MYLFDTDTLSSIVKPRPSIGLVRKLEGLPAAVQFTTAINVGEISFGAARSPKRELILNAFEKSVFPNIHILSFDEDSGRIFGYL